MTPEALALARRVFSQGTDLSRETVGKLLAHVEALDGNEAWRQDYLEALEDKAQAESARDALAEEVAQLREAHANCDAVEAEAWRRGVKHGLRGGTHGAEPLNSPAVLLEREACARVAESTCEDESRAANEPHRQYRKAWNDACRRIAAAIRARGDMPTSMSASKLSAQRCAYETPKTAHVAPDMHRPQTEHPESPKQPRDAAPAEPSSAERGAVPKTAGELWYRDVIAPWNAAHPAITEPLTGITTHRHEGPCDETCAGWDANGSPTNGVTK